MTRVILNGALGRMGCETTNAVNNSKDFEIAARVDINAKGDGVYNNIEDVDIDADVIVDFSCHSATHGLLEYAIKRNIPTLIATTGHTEEEKKEIEAAAKKIAIFQSANMSLGVALLIELAVKAAKVMKDADIEIVETHHKRKLDAPSGTALAIAEEIKKVRTDSVIKSGRSGKGAREEGEIGIQSVRMGNIVGIHEVMISSESQTVTLKHEAHSRALFAEGALCAAEFLKGKGAGLYSMISLIQKE